MGGLVKFIGDGERFLDMEEQQFKEEISYTHAHSQANDYTLCGETLDGDKETAGSFININAKYVTCPLCVSTIEYCKKLKTKI